MLTDSDVLKRLTPSVREYRATHFVLGDDLAKLVQVQSVLAPEAVILYCARILEALAADALNRLQMRPSPHVFNNLEVLRQMEQFSSSQSNWAHALRRLGNEVRHLHCPLDSDDAVLACLLLERWLGWFFCSFPRGPRVESLTIDREGLALIGASNLSQLLCEFEAPEVDPRNLVPHLQSPAGLSALRCPALFAMVIEMLMDRQEHELAWTVLTPALARFPGDLRLLQLKGLWHSRQLQIPEALACLEPLLARSPEDGETSGILAGILKRQWAQNPAAKDSLAQSHRLYREGWKKSRRSNAYLGLNAATTALWMGDAERSRQLAEAVRECLTEREHVLTRLFPNHDPFANYWESICLAEAEVLLGEYEPARMRYRVLFTRHPERKQNHLNAKEQLGRILGVLIGNPDADAFLK